MTGILLILAAAVMNAVASVCQRRASRDESDDRGGGVRLVLDLLQRPVWLAGITAMVAGFLLQAVALTVGGIALVQPLLVAELPLTLLLGSWVFHSGLHRRAWVAIGGLALGLAMFVFGLSPTGGDPGATPLALWLVAGGLVVAIVVALVLLARRLRASKAALLGVATGAAFGLVASLVAGAGAAWSDGGFGLLATSWQTYAAIVVGPLSFFLLQNALQAGSLVASQPGFTLVNPLVAVLWGILVFGEQPRGGAWFALTAAGACLITAATILLMRVQQTTGAETGETDDPTGIEPTSGDEPCRPAGAAASMTTGGASPEATLSARH